MHYDTLPQTATVLAGQTSVVVPLVVLDDGVVYGDRTVTVSVGDGNYSVSGEGAASVALHDGTQDTTPLVAIAATDDYALEPDPNSQDPLDTAAFTITRTGNTTNALTVYYQIGGTATPDVDYVALSGSVTIAAGAASADIVVTPLALASEPVDPDPLEHTLEITLTNALNPADYKLPTGNNGGLIATALIATRAALASTAQATLASVSYANSFQIYKDPIKNSNTLQPYVLKSNLLVNGKQFPVAYWSGETAEMDVTLQAKNVTPFKAAGTVWVRGTLDDGTVFCTGTKVIQNVPKDGITVHVTAANAFDSVAYDGAFHITWNFSVNGADWKKFSEASGTVTATTNRLFVTYARPLTHLKSNPNMPTAYESALWQGCRFAQGAEFTGELIERIWNGNYEGAGASSFANRTVTKIDGTTKLTYYNNWELYKVTPDFKVDPELGVTFERLLANGDGICDAWASYFKYVLRVQGIGQNDAKVVSIVPNAKAPSDKFMVQKWEVVGQARADNTYYNVIPQVKTRNANQGLLLDTDANGKWHYVFDPNHTEVEYKGGLSQSNNQPLATFVGHVVVLIGNDIYDPSYGKVYYGPAGARIVGDTTALLKFQRQAVFGFYTPFINRLQKGKGKPEVDVNRVPLNTNAIRIEQIDPASSKLYFKLVNY